MTNWQGQPLPSSGDIKAVPISNAINHLFGTVTAGTVLARPTGAKYLYVKADLKNWTFKSGDVTAKTWASTAVVTAADTITLTAHNLTTGDGPFQLTTAGGLPTGLAASTDYYAIVVDANTIKLADTAAHALAGTAIDLTTQGSGNSTISGLPAAESPSAAVSNGSGRLLVNEGKDATLPAPALITAKCFDVAGVLTYWWI